MAFVGHEPVALCHCIAAQAGVASALCGGGWVMTGSSLHSVDLNLLVVFSMLMKEKNVTRCATRLNVGQSAVSNSLSRLRTLFDDPLFVRAAKGVEPTEKAMSIAQLVGPALDLIDLALSGEEKFLPETCDQEFSIAVSSGVCVALVLGLVKPMRKLAPSISIAVERADIQSIPNRLAVGRATIGIGYFSDDLKGLGAETLMSCRSVLVRARETAAVESVEDFCKRPHAVIPFGEGLAQDIDRKVAEHKLQRRIVVRLSSADAIEDMIAGTDIVAVMPDFEAHRLQGLPSLAVDTLPEDLESQFDLRMIWSHGKAVSAPDLWFRDQVAGLITCVSSWTHAMSATPSVRSALRAVAIEP